MWTVHKRGVCFQNQNVGGAKREAVFYMRSSLTVSKQNAGLTVGASLTLPRLAIDTEQKEINGKVIPRLVICAVIA